MRDVTTSLRIPIANVFKSQGSGAVSVSGRLIAGIVQTGERLRVLPGDESAIVKCRKCFSAFLSQRVKFLPISN